MRSSLLPIALCSASVGAFLTPHAHAQSPTDAVGCIERGNDSHGLTLTNTCSFKVHVYYAHGNQSWNNYIDPGQTDQTYHRGDVSIYACGADYYVVDSNGRVITSEVDSFHCKKK